MIYKLLTSIKKSVYDYLEDAINASEYTVGEGVGEVRFYDAFPEVNELGEYLNLTLPAVALDFERDNPIKPADLGMTKQYTVEFEVIVFGRTNFEREYLFSVIKDAVEDRSIPYKDYNDVVTITPIVGYLRVSDGSVVPIREETPGDLEKHKGAVYFTVALLEDY